MKLDLLGISLIMFTAAIVGRAAEAIPKATIPVILGERQTNSLILQDVVLPAVGPIQVFSQATGSSMVRIRPQKESFGEGEPVIVQLEIDLHGAEYTKGIPPARIKTDQGDYMLEFYVNPVPFSNYTPSRFTVAPGTAPVPFEFRGIRPGCLFTDLRVEPADSPVDVQWMVHGDGVALTGAISIVANPAAGQRDGKIHDATIFVQTKDGETDFIRFQWFIPKPTVASPAAQ